MPNHADSIGQHEETNHDKHAGADISPFLTPPIIDVSEFHDAPQYFLARGGKQRRIHWLEFYPQNLSQNKNDGHKNHREGHEFYSCRFSLSKDRGFSR
jgi:hypothetical protein